MLETLYVLLCFLMVSAWFALEHLLFMDHELEQILYYMLNQMGLGIELDIPSNLSYFIYMYLDWVIDTQATDNYVV